MDIDIERRVNETIEQLRKLSIDGIDFNQMDPIAKMMLIALINEVQKIQDYVDGTSQRIVERYCSDFIPYGNVNAVPAITIIKPDFKKKGRGYAATYTGRESYFAYKNEEKQIRKPVNYIPLFNTFIIPPYKDEKLREFESDSPFFLSHHKLTCKGVDYQVQMDIRNHIWIGIRSCDEIDCLNGLSLLIRGTNGITPSRISISEEDMDLDFSTMCELENIEMPTPFDAQQSSGQFFSFIQIWKEYLLNMEDTSLIYITDARHNRDVFKYKTFPHAFKNYVYENELKLLDSDVNRAIWLKLEFPQEYIIPESCEILINVLPVVNVDVNNLTLTQASPIAKLQKQEDSFFLKILETSSSSQKQGFNMTSEEIIVRDFDASCYHNGNLYRDVRNLYNRFIDDYYAFIEYNGIKDGEVLKQLRETINQLGKSVGDKNAKFKFDSGTYVMKNMNQFPLTTSTKVSYITTQGKVGNTPQIGDIMENKKLPAIDKMFIVVVPAMGGTDKITADERYEQLRYYSLTNDRLYTKMDIEAFLRKEIMAEFGKSEFKRIYIRLNIEGAGGQTSLQRGLYIDIEFKDKKNYEKAINKSLDKKIRQKIEGKSCISMPIIIVLKNLEID